MSITETCIEKSETRGTFWKIFIVLEKFPFLVEIHVYCGLRREKSKFMEINAL